MSFLLGPPSILRCGFCYPFLRSYNNQFKNLFNYNDAFVSNLPHSRPFFSLTSPARLPPLTMSSSTKAPAQIQGFSEAGDAVNVFELIQAHQKKAARLSPIDEVRTVLNYSLRGVLSTFSKKYEGYPSGSMLDFACDANGSLILAISNLAAHSKDLLANPKCSLLVAKDPEDRTDLMINVYGDIVPVSETDKEDARATYLVRHPDAFWVDFGDFHFLRIEPKVVRYVSGVATAFLGSGEFSREDLRVARIDPIYQFSEPIRSHMNKDHTEDTKLIVRHSTSVPVEFAWMLDVDSLGFYVKAVYQGSTFKLRVPFPRPAIDRKDVKTLIVQMLEAARTQGV